MKRFLTDEQRKALIAKFKKNVEAFYSNLDNWQLAEMQKWNGEKGVLDVKVWWCAKPWDIVASTMGKDGNKCVLQYSNMGWGVYFWNGKEEIEDFEEKAELDKWCENIRRSKQPHI